VACSFAAAFGAAHLLAVEGFLSRLVLPRGDGLTLVYLRPKTLPGFVFEALAKLVRLDCAVDRVAHDEHGGEATEQDCGGLLVHEFSSQVAVIQAPLRGGSGLTCCMWSGVPREMQSPQRMVLFVVKRRRPLSIFCPHCEQEYFAHRAQPQTTRGSSSAPWIMSMTFSVILSAIMRAIGLGFTCGPHKTQEGHPVGRPPAPGRHAKRAREQAGEARPFLLLARQVQP